MTSDTPAPPQAPRRGARGALAIGLFAVTGGIWLLLVNSGVEVPFSRLWPIFFTLLGVASLVDYALSKRAGSIGWAVIGFGFGVLGFALSLDFTSLAKILDWLPSFPVIIGLSFLATWLVDGQKDQGQFVAGLLFVVIGLLGFAARFDVLQRILPSAQVIWAVLLLVGGGMILWRAVSRREG